MFWRMGQSFTKTDTAVIQKARRKRREVIVLREDSGWLREFSASPKDMVRRMAGRGSLISLGAGRYAIPVIGSDSPAYKAWQPMLDARLAPLGDYYLAGFSALIEHRLTDLSDTTTSVVVGFWNSKLSAGEMTIAGRPLRAAMTRRPLIQRELGIDLIRISRTETYRRSNVSRTLVDCLWHPELCGSPETWMLAWGRAELYGDLDPETICRYARVLGRSVTCRAGLMLSLLDHGDVARELLAGARRSGRITPLIAHDVLADHREIDKTWNVAFSVSRERVEGWLSYGK